MPGAQARTGTRRHVTAGRDPCASCREHLQRRLFNGVPLQVKPRSFCTATWQSDALGAWRRLASTHTLRKHIATAPAAAVRAAAHCCKDACLRPARPLSTAGAPLGGRQRAEAAAHRSPGRRRARAGRRPAPHPPALRDPAPCSARAWRLPGSQQGHDPEALTACLRSASHRCLADHAPLPDALAPDTQLIQPRGGPGSQAQPARHCSGPPARISASD